MQEAAYISANRLATELAIKMAMPPEWKTTITFDATREDYIADENDIKLFVERITGYLEAALELEAEMIIDEYQSNINTLISDHVSIKEKSKLIKYFAYSEFDSFPVGEMDNYLRDGFQKVIERVLGIKYMSVAEKFIQEHLQGL